MNVVLSCLLYTQRKYSLNRIITNTQWTKSVCILHEKKDTVLLYKYKQIAVCENECTKISNIGKHYTKPATRMTNSTTT